MQIKKKLPIVFNLLSCVSLLVLALVTDIYSTNITIEKSKRNMLQIAISEGKALESIAKANLFQMQLVASDEKVVKYILAKPSQREVMKEKISTYLRKSLVSSSDYEVCLIDDLGEVILSCYRNSKVKGINNSEVFSQVMLGRGIFEKVVDTNYNNGKVINLTVPVRGSNGEVIGAVCRVLSNGVFREFGKEIQVNEKSYMYIVDKGLNMLVHPQIEKEGNPIESVALRNHLNEFIQSKMVSGSYTYTLDDEERYVAFYFAKDIGWTVCIEQSVADMQKQAIVGSMFIIVALIILVVMITIVSRCIVKEIVTPIDMLIETMGCVAKGDLSSYCSYSANDEFGELSRHYNHMIRKLEESNNALCESEERYRMALDAIDQVIWEYNVEENNFLATENWDKIIGRKIEAEDISEVLEKNIDAKDTARLKESLDKCLAGEISDFTHDIWIKKDGVKCCLLCKGHAIVNSGGKVEKLIGILTDITNNKNNEERMKKLAYFDELTGCLNKSSFIENLDNWLKGYGEQKSGVLLFIDVDDFKKVNDSLGYDIGDKCLNYIGKKLSEILSQEAFIGRFGGDEFVIFKRVMYDMSEVHELIYNILSLFQDKLKIDKMNVHLTSSIGIAMYPDDGEDSTILLKNADTAMYKVKKNGKNSYSFYTKSMSQVLDRKLLVEEAIREAITKDSFYIQYQPVVELKQERTVGCEALIRLCDSELGFISPGEFIPIAEETDLIIQTGDWVLENALETLKCLHDKGYTEFTMNINVSAVQIKEKDFLEKLVNVIRKIGISPECIKLEVTESVLMEDVEKSIELFKKVKEMGIKIALDDFGTGYSSLNYLRSIPLDILKIDKSFVDEIATSKVLSEIVDSIIGMAHALDILVVAEGVEDDMQLEVLRKKGCDYIQGYYFSKPLDEEKLEDRLRGEKNNT